MSRPDSGSGSGAGGGGPPRPGSAATRLARAWRELPPERRLAAGASLGLSVTLFLPWYQETVIANGVTSLRSVSASLTGWGAFSFVEAALLLVAAGVLTLLFVRAEGQAFHVPGGDGGVITAAGFWTCGLILWRMFDKSGTTGHGQYATTSGIEWGILIAFGVAALLAYAGSRIRLAHEPEPPLPGERQPRDGRSGGVVAIVRRGRAKATGSGSGSRSGSRSGSLDLPDTWTQPPARTAPAEDSAARRSARRRRPRSVAGAEPAPRAAPRADSDEPRTLRSDAEPPTVGSRRSPPPPTPAPADETEGQLTIGLDRPK